MADSESPPWLSILLLLFATLGFLANVLVCVTIYKTKVLHQVTNYLILNLAVSDGMCSFIFGLDMLMTLLGYPSNATSEAAQILYCRLFHGNYLFQSFAYASAYNLVLISLERYIGIVSPLAYLRVCTKGRVCLAVTLAWTLGFCAYTVHLVGVEYKRDNASFRERCRLVHDWQWHFVPFVGGFVVPLVIMIWAYSRIIRALKQSARNQDVAAYANESLDAKKRVVHLMLIITITYVVLYIPTQPAYMVIVTVNLNTFELSPVGILLTKLVSKLPVLLNSVINPFIYAFKYRKFQKGMREVMCGCCRGSVSPHHAVHIDGHSMDTRIQQP